jgi:septum formation protein
MLVLASASPRRAELLTQAGHSFTIHPAGIPEERRLNEAPTAFATRLAREKADGVYSALGPETVVLGADTIVVAPDGSVLGKPANGEDAARMLRLLAGSTHQVITGVCLRSAARTEVAAELTYVTMLTLSEQDIAAYIATGEPFGKAGAYAIQGLAARWIPRIHGCYFNVVGLPLALVTSMLEAAGHGAAGILSDSQSTS